MKTFKIYIVELEKIFSVYGFLILWFFRLCVWLDSFSDVCRNYVCKGNSTWKASDLFSDLVGLSSEFPLVCLRRLGHSVFGFDFVGVVVLDVSRGATTETVVWTAGNSRLYGNFIDRRKVGDEFIRVEV